MNAFAALRYAIRSGVDGPRPRHDEPCHAFIARPTGHGLADRSAPKNDITDAEEQQVLAVLRNRAPAG